MLKTPDPREKQAVETIESQAMSPKQLAAFMQTDVARWINAANERKIELSS